MTPRRLLVEFPCPRSTNPWAEGAFSGAGNPLSPAQVVVFRLPHFRVYWRSCTHPKFFVSVMLCASGTNGSSPRVADVCGCWPATAFALNVMDVGIPGNTGRKLICSGAEAVTFTK